MKLRILSTLVFAVSSAPMAAPAAETRPACVSEDGNLPAEFAGWTARTALTSATKSGDLPRASLVVGKAVTATLHPSGQVAYAAEPEKADGPPGHGGLFGLRIAQAGTYTVALGSSPWVDVVKAGKPLDSTAHGHGPDCSSIGKVVAFQLQPGRYVVQVVANTAPTLAIMVARNR